MFSLIIPYHNRATFLPRTLQSILQSTVKPDRLFLVDNGSTDASAEVCRAFAAAHEEMQITLLTEEKQGAAAARNAALRQVETEWAYFFDSDDELSPDFFENALQCVRLHPDADLIACPTRMVFADGSERVRAVLFSASPADQILSAQLNTQGMWLRTAFLRNVGGWNEALPKWNDWELGLRLLVSGAKVQWMRGKVFHRLYQHADSLTGSSYSSTLAAIEPALRAAEALCEGQPALFAALGFREALLAGSLRREGSPEARRILCLSRQTAGKSERKLAAFFAHLLYLYTRFGGRGGWQIGRKIGEIAHF